MTAAACPVTVHEPTTPRPHARGEITFRSRPCGEPVVAGGLLCAKHLADRERLGGGVA